MRPPRLVVAIMSVVTFLVAGAAGAAASPRPAEANTLQYGDLVVFQSQYDGSQGGYLDTRDASTAPDALYDVSTAVSHDRDDGSGTWRLMSATSKPDGSDVVSGDVVYLFNQYRGFGGYLDVNGASSLPGARYDVTTTATKDRDDGSGRWRVFATTSVPTDGRVREGDILHLLSDFGGAAGGFLDVNGPAGNGNLYAVATSPYSDREPYSGSWQVSLAP